MKKRVCVFGLSTFGKSLIQKLAVLGYEVSLVDCDGENIQDIKRYITDFYIEDLWNETFIADLNEREKYDIVVIAVEDMVLASVLAVLLSKAGKKPWIIARSNNDIQSRALTKMGADQVICPELESGERLAIEIDLAGCTR